MKNRDVQFRKKCRRCDRVSAFGFCMMIYFSPISSALMEWSFAFVFFPFIIKKFLSFLYNYQANNQDLENRSTRGLFGLLLNSYKPAAYPLNKQLSYFIGMVAISVVFSINPVMSVKSFFYDLLQGVFIYYIFIEVITTQKRLKAVLILCVMSALLIPINGLFQLFNGQGFVRNFPVIDGRIASTFTHANDFAGYLLLMIPIMLSLSLIYKGKPQIINLSDSLALKFMNQTWMRLITTLSLIIMLFCLGYTFSRAAWVGLFLMLALFSFISKRNTVSFMIIGLIFISFFYPKLNDIRNVSFISDNVQTDIVRDKTWKDKLFMFGGMGRRTYWNEAFNVIKQFPLTGSGLKTYREAGAIYNKNWSGYHAHNCYLQITAETGILGLVSFLWLLFHLFKTTFSNIENHKNNAYSFLVGGCMVGLFGFLFQSAFDTNLYSTKLYTLFWFFVGLLVALQRNFMLAGTQKDA